MPTKAMLSYETYSVIRDPTVSIQEQINRGGYGYANPAINSGNFKLSLSGSRDIVLYDPRGFVSSEEMIRRMDGDGFLSATLDDALAFGIEHPDRQCQNPIVFLGTVWRGSDRDRRVPVLNHWDGRRGLHLRWFDSVWDGSCRFAAVRKP